MNVKHTTPSDLFPTLVTSSAAILNIHTLASMLKVKCRRRGKQAKVLVRLQQRSFQTPLLDIFLSDVCSLGNKLDKFQLPVGGGNQRLVLICRFVFHGDMAEWNCPRHCSTSGRIPQGGGMFYINISLCNDVTVIQQHHSPRLESFFISCKPFNSPRECA